MLTQDNVYVSDSGVQLKLKRVNSFLVLQAQQQVEMPQVPVVYLEDKGREEENPNDPNYLRAVQEANIKRADRSINLLLGFGTEVLNPLPQGIADVADEEWVTDLTEMLGVEIPTNKKLRHAYWLKAIALTDQEIVDVVNGITALSGLVKEEAAEQAADTFPSDEGRDTIGAVSNTEQS